MLADMNEHMKEQHTLSNCDEEQASIDRKNIIREHEVLR